MVFINPPGDAISQVIDVKELMTRRDHPSGGLFFLMSKICPI
jgi:hypothetical protein